MRSSPTCSTPLLSSRRVLTCAPPTTPRARSLLVYDSSIFVNVPVGQTKTFQKAYKLPYPNEIVTFKTTDFDNWDADIPDWYWQP